MAEGAPMGKLMEKKFKGDERGIHEEVIS